MKRFCIISISIIITCSLACSYEKSYDADLKYIKEITGVNTLVDSNVIEIIDNHEGLFIGVFKINDNDNFRVNYNLEYMESASYFSHKINDNWLSKNNQFIDDDFKFLYYYSNCDDGIKWTLIEYTMSSKIYIEILGLDLHGNVFPCDGK